MNIEKVATATVPKYIANNRVADDIVAQSVSEAFIFVGKDFGNDRILGFGSNDSLLVDHKIFDGNGDGIISFGENNALDINRSNKSNGGKYAIGITGDVDYGLRYLGVKDGVYAYASAATAINVSKADSINYPTENYDYEGKVTEGTIGDDTFSKRFDIILFDTALGLNTGIDNVEHIGYTQIVTTTRITTEVVAEYTRDGYERMVIADGVLNLDGGGEVHGILADGQNDYFSLRDIREFEGVNYYLYFLDNLYG